MAKSGEAKAYASALTRVAELGSTGRTPILAAGAGRRKEIFARVEALLDETRNRMPAASGPMVLAVGLLLVFVVVKAAPFSRLLSVEDYQRSSVIDDGKTRREFRMKGEIVFREDEKDVDSITSGPSMVLSRRDSWVTRTVKIEADEQGRISRLYFVGGLSQPYSSKAARLLERELPQWLKDREDRLPQRLEKWLKSEGVEGALREVQTVTEVNAKVQYLDRLMKDTPMDSAQMRRWLRMASEVYVEPEKIRLAGMAQAHVKAMALEVPMLDLIHTLNGEEDRADLLRKIVREIDPSISRRMLREVAALHTEGLKQELLQGISERLTGPLPAAFFEVTRGIHGEEARKEILLKVLVSHGQERTIQEQVVAEAAELHSSDYKRDVLLAVAKHPQTGVDVKEKIHNLAVQMHDEKDREMVLNQLSLR